ncbi:hypothetical protein RB593_006083 [Gaeumannomyces tritici]
MASEAPPYPRFEPGDHDAFMELAIEEAKKSQPDPGKFAVGAVLVDADTGQVLSSGFYLEYPDDYLGDVGSTHAERSCFIKIAEAYGIPEDRIHKVLPPNTAVYTTLEPCSARPSGDTPCISRILGLRSVVKTVYVGVRTPGASPARDDGKEALEAGGVSVIYPSEHLKDRITEVSMAGRTKA